MSVVDLLVLSDIGTYRVRSVFGAHTGSIEQETHGGHLLSLAFAEGIHELLQLRGALNLEEDFIVVVGNLDVEVLHRGGAAFLLGRHFEDG